MVGKSSSRTPRLASDVRPRMDKRASYVNASVSHKQPSNLNRSVQNQNRLDCMNRNHSLLSPSIYRQLDSSELNFCRSFPTKLRHVTLAAIHAEYLLPVLFGNALQQCSFHQQPSDFHLQWFDPSRPTALKLSSWQITSFTSQHLQLYLPQTVQNPWKLSRGEITSAGDLRWCHHLQQT